MKLIPYLVEMALHGKKYWNTLNAHLACSNTGTNSSNTMKITWKPVDDQHANRLAVKLNNINDHYAQDNFTDFRDNHFYLQSHWGSGVIFTSLTKFDPDKG